MSNIRYWNYYLTTLFWLSCFFGSTGRIRVWFVLGHGKTRQVVLVMFAFCTGIQVIDLTCKATEAIQKTFFHLKYGRQRPRQHVFTDNGFLNRKHDSKPFLEVWTLGSYRTASIFRACDDFYCALKSTCFEPERKVGRLAGLVALLTIFCACLEFHRVTCFRR